MAADRPDGRRIVEAGYDRIAEHYLAGKGPLEPETLALLERTVRGLPPDAAVLDLGCGAGVPVTRWLAERFAVTGVDLSARQLELARHNVPGATFVQADMAGLTFPRGTFAAIVSFYAIIHLPRDAQPELLRRIHDWLAPGGAFLANWAVTAWEGEERDWLGWGAAMWWSHHDGATNLRLLREAGFAIEAAEARASDGERWLWVIARKAGTDDH